MGRLRQLDPVIEPSVPTVPNFLHYFVPETLVLGSKIPRLPGDHFQYVGGDRRISKEGDPRDDRRVTRSKGWTAGTIDLTPDPLLWQSGL
jgi:hypothetical protein